MFLKRLRVENLRSLRSAELSFDCAESPVRKWTLILGENGSGKSSLLRAIGLVMAGSDALPELLGEPDPWIRNGARTARIEADLVTAEGDARPISISLKRGEGVASLLRRNAKSLSLLDRALRHADRSYLTVGYGVSRRLGTGLEQSFLKESLFRAPRAQTVGTLFSNDASLNSLEAWAMDLDYRRGRAGLEVVKATLDGLMPNVRFTSIDKRQRRLLFKTPDGIVPLAQLSDGYQNVAAWCGDLLFRISQTFGDYANPLSARGLLLIDEMELHLHPVWQRQLRMFVNDTLPNFQIVATTHSALTAQQAGPEELFVVRRAKPDAAPGLLQLPVEPQKLLVHQLLLSDMFGLTSLNSPQVEARRVEYRSLTAKAKRSANDTKRLGELREELADVPDWTRETPSDRRRQAVLDQVARELLPQRRHADALRAAAFGAARVTPVAQTKRAATKRAATKRGPTKRAATERSASESPAKQAKGRRGVSRSAVAGTKTASRNRSGGPRSAAGGAKPRTRERAR